jgi:DNA (cytosine-5)-methyltransferase 1
MKHKVLIDLFCGTGGFSHGWIQGGGGIAVSVDNWEDALKNHALNHPDVPVLNLSLGGDLQETAETLLAYLATYCAAHGIEPEDLHFHLHGSPPCQAISTASHSRSSADGYLMVQWFIDLVALMNPDSWSMENVVPVRKFLDSLSTPVPYVVANSNDYGVAQKRKRVFAGEGWVLKPTNQGLTVQDVLPDLIGSTLEAAPSMSAKRRWTKLGLDQPFPTVTSSSPSQIRIVSRRRKAHEEPQSYTIDGPAHTITQVTHIVEELDEETEEITKRGFTVREAATLQGWPDLQFAEGISAKSKRVMVGNMVCPPIAKIMCESL